jgi:hypothetical protein
MGVHESSTLAKALLWCYSWEQLGEHIGNKKDKKNLASLLQTKIKENLNPECAC